MTNTNNNININDIINKIKKKKLNSNSIATL